jgi:hypothetical protein
MHPSSYCRPRFSDQSPGRNLSGIEPLDSFNYINYLHYLTYSLVRSIHLPIYPSIDLFIYSILSYKVTCTRKLRAASEWLHDAISPMRLGLACFFRSRSSHGQIMSSSICAAFASFSGRWRYRPKSATARVLRVL